MSTQEEKILVAPCGLSCGHCPHYLAKDDPVLMAWLVSKGVNREKLPCKGCRPLEGKMGFVACTKEKPFESPDVGGTCATYACAVEHKVDFCHECQEFPCGKIQPGADRANELPHNMKVFNLCYIKHQGLTQFLNNYPVFMPRYIFGKMVIGEGPQLSSEEWKMIEARFREGAK